MTTVVDDAAQRPQTHILSIGVGAYRHLSRDPGGWLAGGRLARLTSPPRSAVAFADWAATMLKNPDKPLGSLELLLSPAQDYHLRGGGPVAVEEATWDRVKRAFVRWVERCSLHPDNVAMFFFCGHGLEHGDLHLLLDDVGADDFTPLHNAVNFTKTYRALRRCAAKTQCFFIDACRELAPKLLDYSMESRALWDPPVGWGNTRRDAPKYYSTFETGAAFGAEDRPSVWTQLLLRALAAPAEQQPDGTWAVTTSNLHNAIMRLYRRRRPGAPEPDEDQEPRACGETGETVLHVVADPLVDVSVACRPHAVTSRASFTLTSREDVELLLRRSPGEPDPWYLDLPTGSYDLRANFPLDGLPEARRSAMVWPPARDIEVPVEAALPTLVPRP